MDKRQLDILTTVALMLFGLVLYFWTAIQEILPPEYLVAGTLAIGIVSQLTSNARVKEATEVVKKWIYFDYITSFLLVAWPIVLLFQDNILGAIPVAYVGAGSFILATISQWVADKRAEKSETLLTDDTVELPSEEPQ